MKLLAIVRYQMRQTRFQQLMRSQEVNSVAISNSGYTSLTRHRTRSYTFSSLGIVLSIPGFNPRHWLLSAPYILWTNGNVAMDVQFGCSDLHSPEIFLASPNCDSRKLVRLDYDVIGFWRSMTELATPQIRYSASAEQVTT